MRSLPWFLALTFLPPSPTVAQIRVTFGPQMGYYRPYGRFDPASVYATSLPQTPQDLGGAAWGGGAQAWFGRRLGAELQVAVANSTVRQVLTPDGPRGPTPAQVEMGTLQGLLSVLGTPSGPRLWVSAGAGAIRHGGRAYAPYGTSAQLAGAVGVGAQVGITPRLRGTLGANTLFYTFDLPMPPELRLNPGSLEHGRRVDALFHFGVSWTLGTR